MKKLVIAAALSALLGCQGTIGSTRPDESPARLDSGAPRDDAGSSPGDDAGSRPADDSGAPLTDAGTAPSCTPTLRASLLWSDDFESGDHARWTGREYGQSWGDDCQTTALTTEHPHGGRHAQRSEISCASSSPDGVHRGYGGLQFSGDTVLPGYTNSGNGLDAPNGIVTTFWSWLEAAPFGDGRWMSLFTINPTCDYRDRVITLGLDNTDGIVRAAHYWPEGTMTIEPGAVAMPRGEWVRTTVYVNLRAGVMHVWQNGRSIEHIAGIARTTPLLCQWHWGLYASADNTDVVLYEDDLAVWRLEEPLGDMSREPSLCP